MFWSTTPSARPLSINFFLCIITKIKSAGTPFSQKQPQHFLRCNLVKQTPFKTCAIMALPISPVRQLPGFICQRSQPRQQPQSTIQADQQSLPSSHTSHMPLSSPPSISMGLRNTSCPHPFQEASKQLPSLAALSAVVNISMKVLILKVAHTSLSPASCPAYQCSFPSHIHTSAAPSPPQHRS